MEYDATDILPGKATSDMRQEAPLVQWTYNVSKEDLQTLWETCFPEDATGFARFFLDQYYVPSQAVCVLNPDGSTVESALYWLPCTYRIDGRMGRFLYIYAMGTHPDYRRRGNLRAMLDFVQQYCLQQGIDGMVLRAMPASKSSVETFDMQPKLTLCGALRTGLDKRADDWCTGAFEDFKRLRMDYLDTLPGCIYWEERELRFVYEDLCQNDKLFFFREASQLHYAIVTRTETGICIEETDCESGVLQRLSGAVTFYRPGNGLYGAHIKTYAKSLQGQDLCKLYFNLMLQ